METISTSPKYSNVREVYEIVSALTAITSPDLVTVPVVLDKQANHSLSPTEGYPCLLT